MSSAQELDTVRSGSSYGDEEDFMTEWAQNVNYFEGLRTSWLVLAVVGFFLGPFFAPFTFFCLCCNYHIKAKRTWYDTFVLLMGAYMIVQMIVTGAFAIYIPLIESRCKEPEHEDSDTCRTYNAHSWVDKYGIFLVYLALFSWIVSAAARHFLSLQADGYDQLPEKMRLLRGVRFEPDIIQPETAMPCPDVPTLVQKLCAFSDIFRTDIALQWKEPEGSDAASDVYTNLDTETYGSGNSTESSISTSTDETVNNPNWKYPMLGGVLLSLAELLLNRTIFSDRSLMEWFTEFDTMMPFTTASLWVMTGLTNSVSLGIFMLYYKQLTGLRSFAKMTNFFSESRQGARILIDIRSTRNLYLWHEARTHLVDQVSAPTSFLRTVFDPTCAIMLLTVVGGGTYIIMNHFFYNNEYDQLSFLVTWHTVYACGFFFIVASFTRKIQRELESQEALVVKQKLGVLEEFKSRCASNWDLVPATPEECAVAAVVLQRCFGSSFTEAEFLRDPDAGRQKWRDALIKLNAWRKREARSRKELDMIEDQMMALEQRFFASDIGKSSWIPFGESVAHQGPSYILPPCGVTTGVAPLYGHINKSESTHRKKSENYRRMCMIQSIVVHARHRNVKPNILGIPLSGYLFILMAVVLSLRIPIVINLILT